MQHGGVADIGITGAGDHQIGILQQALIDVFDAARVVAVHVGRHHFVAVHTRLHGADRIHFCHPYDHAFLAQALRRALTDIAITDHQRALAGHEHVGGAFDGVVETVTAAVAVVVLGFGHGIVDVDGRHFQLVIAQHFQQSVHAGGGLFADAVNDAQHVRVFVVDDLGQIATVVQQHIGIPGLAVLENGLVNAPLILFFGLTFPGKDRNPVGRHGGGRVILRREDIAGRPAYFCAQSGQCFNQYRGLHRHVNTTDDLRAGQWLLINVSAAQRHQRRHFSFRQADFLAAELGEVHIGNFIVWHVLFLASWLTNSIVCIGVYLDTESIALRSKLLLL